MLSYKSTIKNFFYYSNNILPIYSNKSFSHRNKKLRTLFKIKNNSLIIFNPKKVSFDLLFIFYTVVVCGSINSASKYLSMTQPSISLSLSKIEKEIGCILFKTSNSKRALQLTIPGLIVFNSIKRLFQITVECLDFTMYKSKQNNSSLNRTENTHKKFLSKKLFSIYNFNTLSSLKSYPYRIISPPITQYYNAKSMSNFDTNLKLFFIQKKIIFFNKKCSYGLLDNKIYKTNLLNRYLLSNLDNNGLIEVNSLAAVHICLEMKIDNFICWLE